MSPMNQRWNVSHRQNDRIFQEKRRQEQSREDRSRRIAKEREMQANFESEDRSEKKRFIRRLHEEKCDRIYEANLIKAEQDRQLKEKQLEQEERMAKELARINNEKLREERMKQYVKENSYELRELERKLQSAYLNRELAAQMAERETMRYEAMSHEAAIAHQMKEEHEFAEMEHEKKEQKNLEEMYRYQQQLEQQLEEKELKKKEAYEEFLKEKLRVDEIVQRIYAENQMAFQQQLEKKAATRKYIEEFQKQQEEWRRMEREKMEAENRRILEIAQSQIRKEEDRLAKAREQEQEKDMLFKKLADQMDRQRREREEMDRVREELYLEERAEAERQQEIREIEKRIQDRLDMQKTCEFMMAAKQWRKQAEKEEEEAFRQSMMAKMAEDDRIEQMNAHKRRMKQLEHKRAVERLLEEKRQRYQAEQEAEAEYRAAEEQREADRRKIIEEERQRLLKQHATKLLGYLPRGVFKEDDLEHFDEEFRNNFKQQRANDEDWEED